MRYLIDSNWVIDCLCVSSRHLRRVAELERDGVALSVIALAELRVGVHRVSEPVLAAQRMNAYISRFSLLPVDSETSEMFGREKARLLQQGNVIEDFDLMLAATAMRHDLTLLSDNRRHFERIAGLRIESV